MKNINNLGKFLTSVHSILIFLVLLIIGMVFDSQTLFYRAFPLDMPYFSKVIASLFLGIAFEFTVLITTVNSDKISKRIPLMLSLCTAIMTLFFFNGFEPNQTWDIYFQRFFVSILIAYMNYIYCELFVIKWREAQTEQSTLEKLSQVEQELSEVQLKLNNTQLELSKAKVELKNMDNYNSELLKNGATWNEKYTELERQYEALKLRTSRSKKNKALEVNK